MTKVRRVTQMELAGFADLVQDAEDAGQRDTPPTPAEVRERAFVARKILGEKIEQENAPDWIERYEELLLSNIPWRIAAYIAWSCVPKRNRTPRTQAEFATQVLGLTSPRRIYEWRRKYPYIDQMVATLQTSVLLDYIPASIEASGKVAAKDDYKSTAERRLLWEAVGIISRNQKITVEEGGLVGKGRKLLEQLRSMPTSKKIELLGEDAEEFFAEMEEEFAREDAKLAEAEDAQETESEDEAA